MSADDENGAQRFLSSFSDPQAVARYVDGPRRYVPGLEALHRMACVLLAERTPADAKVLVLGAGGGLELKALAEAQPGWTFVGVDPAKEMLRLAEQTVAPFMSRIQLVEGYIDDAPHGPFDAATCLLTLHFLAPPEREETVRQIHRRLKPGAPFVAAHGSFPQEQDERSLWLERYAAYAIASGAEPEQVRTAQAAVGSSPNMLSPDHDEAILRSSGFPDASLFYAAFTWRGWIGHA